MSNTGVWVQAELDDEGKLSVRVYAAAEWRPGETVTVHEEVAADLPDEVRVRVESALAAVLAGCSASALDQAKASALQHAAEILKKEIPGRKRMRFEGEAKPKGSDVV